MTKRIKTTLHLNSIFHPYNRDSLLLKLLGSGNTCKKILMWALVSTEAIAIIFLLLYFKKIFFPIDKKIALKTFLCVLIFFAIAIALWLIVQPLLFKVFVEIPVRAITTKVIEDSGEKYSIGAVLNLIFNPNYKFIVR